MLCKALLALSNTANTVQILIDHRVLIKKDVIESSIAQAICEWRSVGILIDPSMQHKDLVFRPFFELYPVLLL